MEEKFMKMALEEAYKGINSSDGGPFGAVVVKDGEVVGKGHNLVLKNNDPTAHGEITAIRNACENLGTFQLKDCELYTTAEPCPMCLGAILWAGITKVYYGCTKADTTVIGFKDEDFYKIMNDSGNLEKCVCREDCLKLFEDYKNIKDKKSY